MRKRRRILTMIAILLCIPAFSLALTIQDILIGLAESQDAYTAEVSGQMSSCMPYSEERLGHLNNLLKHMTLQIRHSNSVSSVSLALDGTEALTMTEEETDGERRTHFSFDPNTTWLSDSMLISGESLLPALPGWEKTDPVEGTLELTGDLFRIREEAERLAAALPEIFPENTKTSAIKTKIRDLGTATQKIVVTVSKADAEGGAMDRLAEASENATMLFLLSRMEYTGRQQFTLYLDQDGKLMRFQYSGQAGIGADRRKITIEWKLLREEDHSRDEFTLKSPAVSGTNRNNLTLTREETVGTDESTALRMEISYNRVLNRKKSVLKGSADLSLAGDTLRGTAAFTFGDGKNAETMIQLVPEIRYQNAVQWEGSVRYAAVTDGAAQTDLTLQIHVTPGTELVFPETSNQIRMQDSNEEEQAALLDGLQQKIAAALIRPLLAIPPEDLLFLSDELDAEAWQNVLQTANPSSEGGTQP